MKKRFIVSILSISLLCVMGTSQIKSVSAERMMANNLLIESISTRGVGPLVTQNRFTNLNPGVTGAGFRLTANGIWRISSNSWITVTPKIGGTNFMVNTANVTFRCSANTSNRARTGYITITDANGTTKITVSQLGKR